MRVLIVFIILALISACSPFATGTPRPSPHPIQVSFSPTLRPWLEVLNQCAIEHPEIALITQETSVTDPQLMGADITLWFGEPPREITGYAASIGQDELILIAGSSVSLKDIDADQLRALYTETNPRYQVWTYPTGNELRTIFDSTVLGELSPSPYTLLAPNPEAMLAAVTKDSLAIGYVPQSWLTGDIKTISAKDDVQASLQQPILALTDSEPQGSLRAYLICLQNSSP